MVEDWDNPRPVAPAKKEEFTYAEKLACARRELALRKICYPKWAKPGGTKKVADFAREIALMTAIVADYEALARDEEFERDLELRFEKLKDAESAVARALLAQSTRVLLARSIEDDSDDGKAQV